MKWLILPFARIGDVTGRSRRTEFWLFWLAALIVQMLASFVDGAASLSEIAVGMGPVTMAATVILLVPSPIFLP